MNQCFDCHLPVAGVSQGIFGSNAETALAFPTTRQLASKKQNCLAQQKCLALRLFPVSKGLKVMSEKPVNLVTLFLGKTDAGHR